MWKIFFKKDTSVNVIKEGNPVTSSSVSFIGSKLYDDKRVEEEYKIDIGDGEDLSSNEEYNRIRNERNPKDLDIGINEEGNLVGLNVNEIMDKDGEFLINDDAVGKDSQAMDWETQEKTQGDSRPLIMHVGISFTLVKNEKSVESFNQPLCFHLSTRDRALLISTEVLKMARDSSSHPAACKLRWIFADKSIHRYGYHASKVVTKLARAGFHSTVLDVSTSVRRMEKRESVQVCSNFADDRKINQDLLMPGFRNDIAQTHTPNQQEEDDAREAYFCAFLGRLQPSANIATSIGGQSKQDYCH